MASKEKNVYDLKGNKLTKPKKNKASPTEKPAKEAQTTFEAKINKYGFLHFGSKLMEAWQLSKGKEQPVTIEITAEGNLIIKKLP